MTLSCRNCSFDRASMPLYGTRDLKTPQTPSGPLRPLQTSLKTLKPPQTSSDPLKPPQTPSDLIRPQTSSDPLRPALSSHAGTMILWYRYYYYGQLKRIGVHITAPYIKQRVITSW